MEADKTNPPVPVGDESVPQHKRHTNLPLSAHRPAETIKSPSHIPSLASAPRGRQGVHRDAGAPLVRSTARAGTTWLGDYLGVSAGDGTLHVAYVQNASGASHVAHAAAPAP